jgi:hypothetical protein
VEEEKKSVEILEKEKFIARAKTEITEDPKSWIL